LRYGRIAVDPRIAEWVDKVHEGDCLELMRQLPDGCVDAVVTDPPYGTQTTHWDSSIDSQVFSECLRVSTGYSLFAYSNTRLWHILGILHDLGVDTWTLAWHKSNSVGFERHFAPQWTPIVCAYRGAVPFWGKDICYCPITVHDFEHPTPKPLPLAKWLVQRAVESGGLVLDPFLGSGTTAVACVQTGRHFIGMELEPSYVAIARKRIAEAQAQPRLDFEKADPPRQEVMF
jgi:DNA modification methylase